MIGFDRKGMVDDVGHLLLPFSSPGAIFAIPTKWSGREATRSCLQTFSPAKKIKQTKVVAFSAKATHFSNPTAMGEDVLAR